MESSLVVQGIASDQKVLDSNPPLGPLAELEILTCHNAPRNPKVKN